MEKGRHPFPQLDRVIRSQKLELSIHDALLRFVVGTANLDNTQFVDAFDGRYA